MVSTALERLLGVDDSGVTEQERIVQAGERDILRRLIRRIELRDNGSGAYSPRMGRMAALIARNLGMSDAETRLLEIAAPLHDIGKIGMPDAILLKRGALSAEETAIMRTHPRVGHELLRDSSDRLVALAATIALHHHERWNGGGYPHGLRGACIPRAARIAALADVFDALISERVYKAAWPHEQAVDYVRKWRGEQFDAQCVDALLRDPGRLRAIAAQDPVAARPRLLVV